jgi:hypothetical protein
LEDEQRSVAPLEILPTFELDPGEESELLIAEPPPVFPAAEPGIEFVLEDESQSLSLASGAGDPEREETDAEEYVLEIEDVLELEIDELDLEDEEEDDSGR